MIDGRQNQSVISDSADQTIEAGKELARLLKCGDVVALTGPLGAGKTCFIKGIALGLGINEDSIKSPSFTLVNEYYGKYPLYHFDLYRMKKSSELYEIGWDDYLMRDGIVVVEWGEKAEEQLPADCIRISVDIISDSQRRLNLVFA